MTPKNLDAAEGELTLAWMQEISKEKNSALIGSLPFFENGNYTNRLFFVQPDGKYYQYDKRHTFTLAGEDKVYKSVTICGFRFGQEIRKITMFLFT